MKKVLVGLAFLGIVMFLVVLAPSPGWAVAEAGPTPELTPMVYLPVVAKNYCPNAIEFTHVPAYGSYEDLEGNVKIGCFSPNEYVVAVFLYRGGWYNKPYWAQRTTPIDQSGHWVCDVTTGMNDKYAKEYAAFIVPKEYRPPRLSGQHILPQELYDTAVGWVFVEREVS